MRQQSQVHAHHEELRRELRGWLTTPAPEIGYTVVSLWCGHLAELGDEMRFVVALDEPEQVPRALEDVAEAAAGRPVTIWVDDRRRVELIDWALTAHGCVAGHATTHLALVGPMVDAGRTVLPNIVIEEVDDARLENWAGVKLMCFGDTEEPPAREQVAAELATRRAEVALASYELASVDAEPVGVLGYYHGSDQLVFNLGTRVPYRHRGVATAVLRHWVAAGEAGGCRSMIINAEEGGRPEALYRRLGFVDEIYWYRRYHLAGHTG